jgi:hypothetical protein
MILMDKTVVLILLYLIIINNVIANEKGSKDDGDIYMEKNNDDIYEYLVGNYNKLVRPVIHNTETLVVTIDLKLTRLVDIVRYN